MIYMNRKRIYLCLLVWMGVCCSWAQQQLADFMAGQPVKNVYPGMFTTYVCGQNLYWEIPDSLLGHDVMINTILRAPAQPNRDFSKKFGYAGDMIGPVLIRFRKNENSLWMLDPLYDRTVTSKTEVHARIASQRGNERFYEELPIIAQGKQSSLVDVTKLFKTSPLFSLSIASYDLAVGQQKGTGLDVREVVGFENRVLMRMVRHYNSSSVSSSDYVGEWETGLCLALRPVCPMESVEASASYFSINQTVYGEDKYPVRRNGMSKRWHLQIRPEDRERYFGGRTGGACQSYCVLYRP